MTAKTFGDWVPTIAVLALLAWALTYGVEAVGPIIETLIEATK